MLNYRISDDISQICFIKICWNSEFMCVWFSKYFFFHYLQAIEQLQANYVVNEKSLKLLEMVLKKVSSISSISNNHALLLVHGKLLSLYSRYIHVSFWFFGQDVLITKLAKLFEDNFYPIQFPFLRVIFLKSNFHLKKKKLANHYTMTR